MAAENDCLIPAWPEALQHVDVVKARFVLNFLSPCQVQPANFLEIGRILRLAGRPSSEVSDAVAFQLWRALFQPSLSEDPVAQRKFQKPSPAFVVTMPIMQHESIETGRQLELEVLFLGAGVPLIHEFLRSLIHLGYLGLVAGEGRFEVTEVYSRESDGSETRVWRQVEPSELLTCSIQPLLWLLQNEQISKSVIVKFVTPTRLLVNGKPLRKPHFHHIFPFMLRRATSMLYAHGGVEVLDDPAYLLAQVRELNVVDAKLHWHDWHALSGRHDLVVGGFLGEISLEGQALGDVYWVLAVSSFFGIGKGATYGAGRFVLSS